nr:hypothetical protein [Microbacterium barkeri]
MYFSTATCALPDGIRPSAPERLFGPRLGVDVATAVTRTGSPAPCSGLPGSTLPSFVRAGDRVDVVAHSQGGMIAARLAMEGDVDVAMQITAGSPQEPTLTDEQTLIQLRHSDDVVSALAAGGSAEGTGSPFSFTASRVGDPHDGFQDLTLGTHGLESYRETAALVDASDDPRAEALDGYWAELADAVRVERTEFRAERTP